MYPSLLRFPGGLFADFDALAERLDELAGGRNSWPSSIRAVGRGAFPAVNIGSTDDSVEIYAFAPGIDPKSIEVSVDRGLLTLAGSRETNLPQEDRKLSVYARERFSGSFRRVISLPQDADATRVDAQYKDGVLKVVVPRQESAKPRRIDVKGMN